MDQRDLDRAALRGEPSYVWRAGQDRRLELILRFSAVRSAGQVLDDGCGVGMYVQHLQPFGGRVFGLEYDLTRTRQARQISPLITNAAGEELPYPSGTFDLVLSHEVLEHVQDDRRAMEEITRVLKPGGRLMLFLPNRGYPFETHGVYWRGKYHFGNIPLVNYLPHRWRKALAPHVRVYSKSDVEGLVAGLPLKRIQRTVLFGAYDNLIARFGWAGRVLRGILQFLEHTPFKGLGLSHFWVLEKTRVGSERRGIDLD